MRFSPTFALIRVFIDVQWVYGGEVCLSVASGGMQEA